MRRVLLVCVLAGILVLVGTVGMLRSTGTGEPLAQPQRVDSRALGLLPQNDLAATVTGLQERLKAQPDDARSWATLGLAYVEMARLTGDASYYPKADDVLGRSFAVEPEDNDLAHAGEAALAAARHEFGRALRQARAALAINAYQPQALAIRVDALTELGRYSAQLAALEQADRRQPGVPIFARYSYAEELRGHTERAVDILRRALEGATIPADRAFLLTLRADLERRSGDLAAAHASVREALRTVPDFVPALASRARLEVAGGNLPAAVTTWQHVTSRSPLPEYLLELGELYAATGQDELAEQQYAVLQATAALLDGNGVRLDLETAAYEADHGSAVAALDAARAEWSRRQSVHAADAFAWALHVNDKDRAAIRIAAQATRLNTPVPTFWIHRGLIELSLGRMAAAAEHLRKGLRLDPGLSPWQADRARDALDRLAVAG
ncbi:MAG: hypothetical protein H0V23_13890 [Nocardioidaceae bacterium]|nr:hypothetical protein [Nocardioidaceae bacterium]